MLLFLPESALGTPLGSFFVLSVKKALKHETKRNSMNRMLTATRTTSITASEAISEAHNDPLDLANFANEVEDLHMQHADNYPANYPWINKERSVSRKLRHNSKNGKELLVLTLNFFV